ncbi:MAG TPA: hypothetical protein VIM33_13570 [Gaiellaceae bacterium]
MALVIVCPLPVSIVSSSVVVPALPALLPTEIVPFMPWAPWPSIGQYSS